MRVIPIFILNAALLFGQVNIVLASDTHPKSWRCGNHLIQVGDTVGSVLSQCGEPTNKTMDRIQSYGPYRETHTGRLTKGVTTSDTIAVEAWFYILLLWRLVRLHKQACLGAPV